MAAAGSVVTALGVGRYSVQMSGVSIATPPAPPGVPALMLNPDSTNSCAASRAGLRSAHRCPAATIGATSAAGTATPPTPPPPAEALGVGVTLGVWVTVPVGDRRGSWAYTSA